MPRTRLFLLALVVATAPALASAQAYNPYAGPREPPPPPLAADGTIQWGTFYKSAAIQQSYERLWNLGACRGTNQAITKPVESNKLLIDNLPEAEFHGTVKAVTGSVAGGLIAYTEDDGTNPDAPIYVAQFHPAGVTALAVTGAASPAALVSGVTIKVRTTVDAKGRGREPVSQIEIVTLPPGFTPDAVEPDRPCTAVGRVISRRGDTMVMHVNSGKHRRLSLRVADTVTVTVAAAELELVSPGDSLQMVGRLWSGEGAMAAGTVFASKVSIAKQLPPAD
jgi:hypothetical protein